MNSSVHLALHQGQTMPIPLECPNLIIRRFRFQDRNAGRRRAGRRALSARIFSIMTKWQYPERPAGLMQPAPRIDKILAGTKRWSEDVAMRISMAARGICGSNGGSCCRSSFTIRTVSRPMHSATSARLFFQAGRQTDTMGTRTAGTVVLRGGELLFNDL